MEGLNYRDYRVAENTKLTENVYRLVVSGYTECVSAPGQFAHIKIDGFYLPRPISICDWNQEQMTFLYKTVGEGTLKLSLMRPGDSLSMMAGLGNGFDLTDAGDAPLLIGGGLGAAPLFALARRLHNVSLVMGFQTKSDLVLLEEYQSLGICPIIATVDGTAGIKGFVTDALDGNRPTQAYACGPENMLKAVHKFYPRGQYSFEARMACGIGACMGCSCKTKFGSKRICKDGPVIRGEEILW